MRSACPLTSLFSSSGTDMWLTTDILTVALPLSYKQISLPGGIRTHDPLFDC